MSSIERVRLRVLERDVPRIGFGGCPMGRHAWGPTSEADLIAAVRLALERGIAFFDTADIYGLGQSETILGRGLEGRRDEAVVATKFGVRLEGGRTFYDTSPGWIRHALDASLTRLRTDVIDLYQMHYWDQVTPLDDVFGTLEDLRAEGKIRALGVTNLDLSQVATPLPDRLASFSHVYNLTNRSNEPAIEAGRNGHDLTFLSWGSLGHGILSGKYLNDRAFETGDRRNRDTYPAFHGDGLGRSLRIVDAVKAMLPQYPGRTPAQMALRWILDRIPGSVACVGIKTPAQLEENAGALGWRLDAEDVVTLDRISA